MYVKMAKCIKQLAALFKERTTVIVILIASETDVNIRPLKQTPEMLFVG